MASGNLVNAPRSSLTVAYRIEASGKRTAAAPLGRMAGTATTVGRRDKPGDYSFPATVAQVFLTVGIEQPIRFFMSDIRHGMPCLLRLDCTPLNTESAP